jgi:hypothetical protein
MGADFIISVENFSKKARNDLENADSQNFEIVGMIQGEEMKFILF